MVLATLTRWVQFWQMVFYMNIYILNMIYLIVLLPFLLFFTSYWYIAALYLTWTVYKFSQPIRPIEPTEWFRNHWITKYCCEYFPIVLHKTADLRADKNYLMLYHPHGIISVGASCTVGSSGSKFTELFPGITRYGATLDLHFKFPLRTLIAELLGFVPVNFKSLVSRLSRPEGGNALFLVVGGAEEALECHENLHRLCLKHRKGFVRVALTSGAQLVPIYAFGENQTYKTVDNPIGSKLRTYQEYVKKRIGLSPVLFYGTSGIPGVPGLYPLRQRVDVVVGAPIPVEKTENATQEQIDALHELYIKKLTELFDEHKASYGVSKEAKIEFY